MMRIVFIVFLLGVGAMAYGQSSSAHYKSKVRGHLTHGGLQSGTNSKNQTVNIWTEGHEQKSSYATNRVSLGTSSDTSPVSVARLALANDAFIVYPNPFDNEISVLSKNGSSIDKLVLYDATGREVFTANLQVHEASIDVSLIAPGLYTIQVESETQKWFTSLVKP
ncbi:MAG: T9SS type A sorting domain-containing protein [Bacteroidia bacterium]|nr:T9SS type A sorting domain-containing protein [Bacteroidia bacterium]